MNELLRRESGNRAAVMEADSPGGSLRGVPRQPGGATANAKARFEETIETAHDAAVFTLSAFRGTAESAV